MGLTMTEDIRHKYAAVIDRLSVDLSPLGFVLHARQEFTRRRNGVTQRLATSLRHVPGEPTGYIEVFPGFNFPKVESLAASLQGKKPRAGFITCSLNIGLLTPKNATMEWPAHLNEDVEATALSVTQTVMQYAVPFWDEFSSLEELIRHFEEGDPRICRGAEWPWKLVAAYCLAGRPERASELLATRLAQVPAEQRPAVEGALQKISQNAAGR
jgi:hypothetical protein